MGRSAPSSVSVDSSIVDNEVADVEMLLEAYYMHIDAAFNRLQVSRVCAVWLFVLVIACACMHV